MYVWLEAGIVRQAFGLNRDNRPRECVDDEDAADDDDDGDDDEDEDDDCELVVMGCKNCLNCLYFNAINSECESSK